MLIIAMLEKDKSKRPSIWELSEIPCINSTIAQFIKENGLKGNEYIFKELPIKNTYEEEEKYESLYGLK